MSVFCFDDPGSGIGSLKPFLCHFIYVSSELIQQCEHIVDSHFIAILLQLICSDYILAKLKIINKIYIELYIYVYISKIALKAVCSFVELYVLAHSGCISLLKSPIMRSFGQKHRLNIVL